MISSALRRLRTDGIATPAVSRTAPLQWFVAGLSLPLLAVGLLLPDATYKEALRLDRALSEIRPVFTLPLLLNSADLLAGSFGNPVAGTAGHESVDLTVRRGDTLDALFRREGLDLADLQRIMQIDTARKYLRILRPGDQISVGHDGGSILEINRRIDPFNTLNVTRAAAGFDAGVVALDYETRSARTSGEIRSSLFEAAAQSGVSDGTIMNLAAIFASDIDFVLDLREGDRFTIVYEEMWNRGDKLAEGEILAAEFVNQGRTYRAVRFQNRAGQTGYYTPEGRSLRKAFLRAPLAFTRVSSDFNPRRRHPILNTIRAHTGVDYAAPTGTAVRAPADGRVSFRGRKGGYGNAVILQHAGGITTLYGHLSGFTKAARLGHRVSQGEVIGYVGATGLATAPHLHYEYRVNGRHMNPRTVKLPNASTPLDAGERTEFVRAAAPLLQRLDTGGDRLAAGGPRSRPGRSG
ncbi:MAG: peptidoglycan DD-metalloendopeptidase family protein [Gammaproteobacteria bacterium]|nr:peptidoglycan DD-metalloendopeptidase family protein [Gammaproteobacteria bacterium]